MAKQFRKKPVVIEAFQYDGTLTNLRQLFEWVVTVKTETRVHHTEDEKTGQPTGLFIDTLEGTMKVNPGEYVIKGVNNEFYPCKPEIFVQIYEEVL